MENSVLNQLGFDPAYLVFGLIGLCVVLLIFTMICILQLGGLRRKYERFMRGKTAEDMEEMIFAMSDDIKYLRGEDSANKDAIRALNRNIGRTFQSSGLVKYNAFPGMGGESSFALALLDRSRDGYVLNCIHSREGSYLYIKEVKDGEATVLLGTEEEKALKIAKSGK